LKIKDHLQLSRLEWIFGTPGLIDGSMSKANPFEYPKLGVHAVETVSELHLDFFPTMNFNSYVN